MPDTKIESLSVVAADQEIAFEVKINILQAILYINN